MDDDLAAQRARLRRLGAGSAAAERRGDARSFGRTVRPAAVDAAADRPDRARRIVLARRRDRGRPGRGRGGNRVLSQPRLRLLDGGDGGDRRRAALDADFRLSRSRLHARIRRARPSGGLSRAGAHDRQPAARQSRARSSQRLHHSAALQRARSRSDGGQVALDDAHGPRIAANRLRQLRQARRTLGRRRHRGADGRDPRPRPLVARRGMASGAVERAAAAEGRVASGRGRGSPVARRRRRDRLQSRRT